MADFMRLILLSIVLCAACSREAPLEGSEAPAAAAPAAPRIVWNEAPMTQAEIDESFEMLVAADRAFEEETIKERLDFIPVVLGVRGEMDEPYWTVMSLRVARRPPGARPPSSPSDATWIVRRVRAELGESQRVDWATSQRCPRVGPHLDQLRYLRSPRIKQQRWSQRDRLLLSVIPQRELTLWTSWADGSDLRFSASDETDLGRDVLRASSAIAGKMKSRTERVQFFAWFTSCRSSASSPAADLKATPPLPSSPAVAPRPVQTML